MSNTLQVLGITWPKLIAQFINFSIVLFVLWRFAYRPVFAMLETRRLKIAEGIDFAKAVNAKKAFGVHDGMIVPSFRPFVARMLEMFVPETEYTVLADGESKEF